MDLNTGQSLVNTPRVYYFRSIDQNVVNTNQKVSTLTNSNGNTSTQFWNSLTSSILSENTSGETAWYTLCYETASYQTWYVFSGSNSRQIVIKNKTSNTYTINSNNTSFTSSTFTSPTTNPLPSNADEITIKILEEAMNYSFNQMSGSQFNLASTYPALTNVLNLRFAIILQSQTPSINPSTLGLTLNYNGMYYYQRQTQNYNIKIKSLSTVSLTPPSDNITRTAYVYISDGSSSATTSSITNNYTQITQN